MKAETYSGIAPDFRPLAVVEIHSPCCGTRMKIPADTLISHVSNAIEEHYRKHNELLSCENKRLRDIIEFGNQIDLIRRVTKAGSI